MNLDTILIILGLGCYGIASLLALIRLARADSDSERVILLGAALGAAAFGVLLLLHGLRAGRLPAFGRFESLTCYALAVTVAFLTRAAEHRMRGMAGIVLPYATVMLALAVPGVRHEMPPTGAVQNVWLGLHVITAFAGYALFTMSGFFAVAYLIQDHNPKHKRFGAAFERLPSLGVLDHWMYRQMGIAFLMLTVSIAFGIRLVDLWGGGREWFSDPKVAATCATWAVYAVLLHLRGNVRRHGRKIALATIAGLLFVLFTFFGVHLLVDSRHSFVLIPGE